MIPRGTLVEKFLLPLALQPTVGFGLSNNTSPFVPIYYQLSPSSHSQHLKISFHFFFPSFTGSSSSSRPFPVLQWRSFWASYPPPILSRWPSQLILCSFVPFTIFSPLFNSSVSRFVLIFHSPSSYLGPYILLNIFLSKYPRLAGAFSRKQHGAIFRQTCRNGKITLRVRSVAIACRIAACRWDDTSTESRDCCRPADEARRASSLLWILRRKMCWQLALVARWVTHIGSLATI